MYVELQQSIRARFVAVVKEQFGLDSAEPPLGFPPSPAMGDISITSSFDLAKQLRQPPRAIAQRVADHFLPLAGVERLAVAGAGYVNVYLDRAALFSALLEHQKEQPPSSTAAGRGQKILVEHTSINPNKAAHVGHLRNAVLGDTFVRLLRYAGNEVEVENYIDNTGVQVADVVVGFSHLEKKSLEEVREIAEQGANGQRFDYLCWDLYARVFQCYEEEPRLLELRSSTLKAIEEGRGELAEMAAIVSTSISRLHLETMQRLKIQYDLLVEESEILRLDFWKHAFELMKKTGSIYLEHSGKNSGCWVMKLEDAGQDGEAGEGGSEQEDVKIIVRSNGTVTYVGKDIAYHLWKFNLLGLDFSYGRFHRYSSGKEVWRTSPQAEAGAPSFGRGAAAYAVIDTRQAYLQAVVRRAFLSLGYSKQAENMHHFSYEVVGLSPRCAEELGINAGEDGQQRGVVEVSGRKGSGIKADDLINRLEEEALKEVRARAMTPDPAAQQDIARKIAVAALRYFLLKFTRRTVIAFDLQEALAFEGETGPYLQYSAVRAANIFRKYAEAHLSSGGSKPGDVAGREGFETFLDGNQGDPFWELVLQAAQLDAAVEQAITTEEPAALARYAFRLAQTFNNFYHHHHILHETDERRQAFLLLLVAVVSRSLGTALALLGIEIPDRM